MKRKFLSLVLCITMIVMMVPTVVFGETQVVSTTSNNTIYTDGSVGSSSQQYGSLQQPYYDLADAINATEKSRVFTFISYFTQENEVDLVNKDGERTAIDTRLKTEQKNYGDKNVEGYDNLKEVLKTQMVPQSVNALIKTFPITFKYLDQSDIGIGLRLYETSWLSNNDPNISAISYVELKNAYYQAKDGYTMDLIYTLGVNLDQLSYIKRDTGELKPESRKYLETTVAHEMMHGMMYEAFTSGMLGVSIYAPTPDKNKRFSNWFIEGTAQAAGGGADYVRKMGITGDLEEAAIQAKLENHYLNSKDSAYSDYGTGYLAVMYLGYLMNGQDSVNKEDIAHGLDQFLNEIRGGKSLNKAIVDNTGYSSISDFENKFAKDATHFTKLLMQTIGNDGAGALVADSYQATDVLHDEEMAANVFYLNTERGAIQNVYPENYVVISGGQRETNGVVGPKHSSIKDDSEEHLPNVDDSNAEGESSSVDSNVGEGSSSGNSNVGGGSSSGNSNVGGGSSSVDSNVEEGSSSVDSNAEGESSSVDSNVGEGPSSGNSNVGEGSSSGNSNVGGGSSSGDSNAGGGSASGNSNAGGGASSGDNNVGGGVSGAGKHSTEDTIIKITDQYIKDTYNEALVEAKKSQNAVQDITLVLNKNTENKPLNNVTVNLPKGVQDFVISQENIDGIEMIGDSDVKIHMDLDTIKEINKQAKADVNVTITKLDSNKLVGNAKLAIESRPVFELEVTYSTDKQVSNFGTGTVTVEIPYTLRANEKAAHVHAVYSHENGQIEWLNYSVYDSTNKVLRFTTNHFSTYGVGYKNIATNFTDITDHWAKENIEFIVARELLSGTTDTTFSPNTAMPRGMFVTALGKLAKVDVSQYTKSSFNDVKDDADYMGYVEWAAKNNIINGIGEGKFAPDQPITREQMTVIMKNYAQVINFNLPNRHTPVTFVDNAKINVYAKDAVKQMQMAGIMTGKNGNKFVPQGTVTRAEVATILKRFVELVVDNAYNK